jgi:hypothetical protein
MFLSLVVVGSALVLLNALADFVHRGLLNLVADYNLYITVQRDLG